MQLLRSLFYALVFYPATALFVLAGAVATLFGMAATRSLVRSWALGADAYLTKPIDPEQIAIKVRGHLAARAS